MSKVSVVVPIYNVEQYLDKCVKSIISQTYKDLEIILVDDGSIDNSSSLCDEWGKKDSRIKVVHKENGGLSSARNAGLEIATGEYIMFEDSDDWLEIDIVEKSVARIEKDKSDLVIFGYKKVNTKGKELDFFTFGDKTYLNDELLNQLHSRILEMSFGYAWNKLYRLSIIRKSGIVNDGSIIDREDLYFNLSLFNYLNKVSYLEYVGYNYLQRQTSLLHNADLKRIKGIKEFSEKMFSVDLLNGDIKRKIFNMNMIHYLFDCIVKNVLWNKELRRKEKENWIEKIVAECPHIDELYYDEDNPKYLNLLYEGIANDNYKRFIRYINMSSIKRKILSRK